MKAKWCLLPLLLVNISHAQEPAESVVNEPIAVTQPMAEPPVSRGDPTVPSAKILQRLQSLVPASVPTVEADTLPTAAPAAAPKAPDLLPDFDLKAIVMADAHRGTALLECNGRMIVVPLSRAVTRPQPISSAASDSNQRLRGFSVQGQTFTVEDFSSTTLLLRTGERTLLVQ
jgi:hypothetical protein